VVVCEHFKSIVVGHFLLPLEVLEDCLEGELVVVLVGMHVAADEVVEGVLRVLLLRVDGVIVA
jgi:hypothetical protein